MGPHFNFTAVGAALILIFLSWRLWLVFEDVRKRGSNPDAKGKL